MKLLNEQEIKELLIKAIEGEFQVCYCREEYRENKYYYYTTIRNVDPEEEREEPLNEHHPSLNHG
jgi:hypothetical protein